MHLIEKREFETLFQVLKKNNFQIFGPTLRNKTILYDEIHSSQDLPVGWKSEQEPSSYQLSKSGDNTFFGHAVGINSWKKFLYPPKVKLWDAASYPDGFEITENKEAVQKRAFIGVRPCDLKAIALHDKIFLEGTYIDPIYKARREQALIIVVNCGEPASTCFCTSMGAGPKATGNFDIALTEIMKDERHYFVAEVGTAKGEEIIKEMSLKEATSLDIKACEKTLHEAAAKISREIDAKGVKKLLQNNREHPYWDEVADRCLACANCTMVCPTCFCSTVEDVTDLTGQHSERWRLWDSCFTNNFSYIHGGYIRQSTKSRYRHWMTHKLSSWQDQFGSSGCVGCGRCIAWCPVGIDITQGVKAIQEEG